MKNINFYANIAAYNADTNRPTTESTASSVADGTGVIIAGKNILVDKAGAGIGDIVVFDKTDSKTKVIKYGTYQAAGFPANLVPQGVIYDKDEAKCYVTSPSYLPAKRWAQGYRVKLTGFDFATGGTFTITVNSTTTADITYNIGSNLAAVVVLINAAINAGAANTALKNWTVAAGVDYITIEHNNYTPVITSVAVTDAALKVEATTLTPIDYQTTASGVVDLYPTIYRNDGGDTTNAGFNFEKYKSYYSVSGADTTGNTVGSTAGTIKESRFNPTDNPLLTAYYPTYDAYLQDKMAKEIYSKGAIWDRDGKSNTDKLANVTFVDADGSVKPAYPSAYDAKNYEGAQVAGFTTLFDKGAWWLPSAFETYRLIKDRKLDFSDEVNVSLNAVWGAEAMISASMSCWSSTEHSADSAWLYYRTNGFLFNANKTNSNLGRSVSAF
jgi:hypothetical protein